MDQSKNTNIFLSAIFCLSTFIAAFLLFQIEPIVGKIVTPLYGGTANVWNICLFFFQLIVLAGYLITFGITKLKARTQIYLYLSLFVVSLFWSNIPNRQLWQIADSGHPLLHLLLSLTQNVAIPCIILATISGIMQIWFAFAYLGNPYPLYSFSNLGSMLALLSYPILLEPHISVANTLGYWHWLYWALGAIVLICAFIVRARVNAPDFQHIDSDVNLSIRNAF
jgi:hypothetical protein